MALEYFPLRLSALGVPHATYFYFYLDIKLQTEFKQKTKDSEGAVRRAASPGTSAFPLASLIISRCHLPSPCHVTTISGWVLAKSDLSCWPLLLSRSPLLSWYLLSLADCSGRLLRSGSGASPTQRNERND